MHFNPAGMGWLSGNQAVFSAHVILPEVDFDNAGSILSNGATTTGSESGNGGRDAAVPNLYIVWDRGRRLRIGLGLNTPYGLVTQYDADCVGRYQHLFFADGATRRISATNSILIGEFNVDVDVFSAGLSWRF